MNFLRRKSAEGRPDVTVILTIYNNERYIEQAVRSLRKQSFRNFEALCIEDCSTDNSYRVLEDAIANDTRFRIIRHKENKGVSAARNTGIEQAAGDYLIGVDGDDFIDRDAIRILHTEITSNNFDIVACGFRICDEAGKKIATKRFKRETICIDKNVFRGYFDTLKPSFWGKIWKKSLFIENGIRFPDRLYYEDLATTPRLLLFAKRVGIIDRALYSYRQHSQSTTNALNSQHIDDYFHVFSILRTQFESAGILDKLYAEFTTAIEDNIDYHIENIMADPGADESSISEYIEHIRSKKARLIEDLQN